MKWVLDASVALKWFFSDRADKPLVAPAIGLLQRFQMGEDRFPCPPHFMAEMPALLARESPDTANESVNDLLTMTWETTADEVVCRRAIALADTLDHHLFETLHHAVALVHGATLVTADAKYFKTAKEQNAIVWLGEVALATPHRQS